MKSIFVIMLIYLTRVNVKDSQLWLHLQETQLGYINQLSLLFLADFHCSIGSNLHLHFFYGEFASGVSSHSNCKTPPSSMDAYDGTSISNSQIQFHLEHTASLNAVGKAALTRTYCKSRNGAHPPHTLWWLMERR